MLYSKKFRMSNVTFFYWPLALFSLYLVQALDRYQLVHVPPGLGPKLVFFDWCGALCSLTDPSLWLLLLWLLLHPAPTALPPQMIVSTALLRVCLSVRPRWLVLCYMWLRSSPVLYPTSHPLPSHSLTSQSCPISHLLLLLFCSLLLLSNTVSLLRRQKHGAFLTGSDRSHYFSTVSTNQCPPPSPSSAVFFSWTLSSNRKWNSSLAPGVALFLLMHCVLLLRLWWGDSDLSVAWYLVSCPTPLCPPSKLLPPPTVLTFPTCLNCVLPLPPTAHCGFVACIWSISTLQSSLSILYNTVLYCMSVQTCHVGLSWFDFMFCCYYDGIMSLVLMHRMAFRTRCHRFELMLVKKGCIQCTMKKNALKTS